MTKQLRLGHDGGKATQRLSRYSNFQSSLFFISTMIETWPSHTSSDNLGRGSCCQLVLYATGSEQSYMRIADINF